LTQRILFITATRVGDAILSTGLLRHLIGCYPDARVTVACGAAAADLFEAVPNLDRIIVLDKMVFSAHWLGLWWATVGHRWDVLVDLRNSPMAFALLAKNKYRMGRDREPLHRVRRLAGIMKLGDAPPEPILWFSDLHLARARRFVPDGLTVLAIGPTANWRAKMWPADYFSALIDRITGPGGIMEGARVAVFGRDDERPQILRLIDAIPSERRIDLVGHLDLLEAGACLKRCALYIGNDSGLMHLAAAAGIPTLGLFGPTPEELYAPWGERCGVVRTSIPIDQIFPANFDHRTSGSLMESLTVDSVEAAARDLWCRAEAAE
jgi:heptosyltransferase-3